MVLKFPWELLELFRYFPIPKFHTTPGRPYVVCIMESYSCPRRWGHRYCWGSPPSVPYSPEEKTTEHFLERTFPQFVVSLFEVGWLDERRVYRS